MDLYKAIENRRTVRELTGDVPQDVLERILGAALKAPTNNHLREWQFVVLRTPEEKENALQAVASITKAGKVTSAAAPAALAAGGQDVPKEVLAQKAMFSYAMPRQYSMLEGAGCIVLPFFKAAPPFAKLMDDYAAGSAGYSPEAPKSFSEKMESEGMDAKKKAFPMNILNSFAAAWAMIENLLLAAAAEGYATSMRIPVGAEMNEVCKAVGAPEGWVMPCYIGIGRPADSAEKLPQVEPDLSGVMHFGRWQ